MQEKKAGIKELLGLARKAAVPEVGFLGGLARETATSFKRLAGTADIGERGLTNADMIRMSLPLLGIGGAVAGGQAIKEKVDKSRAATKVLAEIKKDPEIAKADEERANALYSTLQQYAPSIAKDPLVSQSFVKGMLQYGHVDHAVVKDLMMAERVHQELKANPFTATQAIKNVSWLA